MLLALFLRYMYVYLLFDGENCRRALGNLINKISKWFWDSINWYQWKCFMGKKEYNLHFIVSSLTWDLHELRLYEGFLKIFSGEKIFVAVMGVSFFLDLSQDLHL